MASDNLRVPSPDGMMIVSPSSPLIHYQDPDGRPLSPPPGSSHLSCSQSESNVAGSIGRSGIRRQERLLLREPDSGVLTEVPLVDASAEKQGLFEMLKRAIGTDLTTISMPIAVHEPTTFLQRMAEGLQYHHLLEEGGQTIDTMRQLMLTTCFAIATYSCNERTGKPFNPYLGETFEYDDGNVRFFAEQVSHHPPIGAAIMEGPGFTFFQDMCVQTKFGGNNLDVSPTGEWHVLFKNNGNHLVWRGVTTVVYSIIIGTMWIDCFGDTEVVSLTTGERAVIKMTKCGWFSKGRWETLALLQNAQGQQIHSISGKWNSELKLDSTGEVLWRNTLGAARPGDKYGRPEHVFELTASPADVLERLPNTDSRFRRDLQALQADDPNRAAAEKRVLEERERSRRRQRTLQSINYHPIWFTKGVPPDSQSGEPMWLFNGEYWKEHGSLDSLSRLGPGPRLVEIFDTALN